METNERCVTFVIHGRAGYKFCQMYDVQHEFAIRPQYTGHYSCTSLLEMDSDSSWYTAPFRYEVHNE